MLGLKDKPLAQRLSHKEERNSGTTMRNGIHGALVSLNCQLDKTSSQLSEHS